MPAAGRAFDFDDIGARKVPCVEAVHRRGLSATRAVQNVVKRQHPHADNSASGPVLARNTPSFGRKSLF